MYRFEVNQAELFIVEENSRLDEKGLSISVVNQQPRIVDLVKVNFTYVENPEFMSNTSVVVKHYTMKHY